MTKKYVTFSKAGEKKDTAYVAKSHLSHERVDAAIERAMAPEIEKSGDRKAVKRQFAEDDGYASEVMGRAHADLVLSSACQAATIQAHTASTASCEVDLEWQMQALERAAARLKSGDMSGAEEILLHQATALGSLFTFLTLRATSNIGHSLDAVEMYMKIALRCQSQARATMETIAAIKNPPVVYARQANFANGPQQVNNNQVSSKRPAHATGTQFEPNELSKATDEQGQRMDCETVSRTIQAGARVATLDTIDGSAVGCGEGAVSS